ncbi:MAG: phosphotransferase family protein [Actinomycetota bacterium]|nr:phosphotransferase family protein [Actinomycetota bacterium]
MAEDEIVLNTPWRRDPGDVGPALERWARETIGPDIELFDIRAPGNGYSSETVLFETRDPSGAVDSLVARLAPMPDVFPVFAEYDLTLQRKCMQLVRADTDVPVPDVVHPEQDASWLGTPFIVMRRVDGVAPLDVPPYVFGGWVMDATPEERAHMQHNAISVLVQLHEITPETHDLSWVTPRQGGDSALERLLAHERWYYEWAREGDTYPLIERSLDWLEKHMPRDIPGVFSWGDARIGNMLWRDFEPVAVLDWEMATVGPREVDLAWMIFLHRFFQDMAERFEMPGLPDFMERDTLAATYEGLSGHTVAHLEWYEVFAALRFAIVSVRTTARSVAYGVQEKTADPDDVIMFRNLLEQMMDGSYWT